MKILLGYSYNLTTSYDVHQAMQIYIQRLNQYGYEVEGFIITPNAPNRHIYWPRLDEQWKLADRALLNLYEQLIYKLEDFDVFINYSGVNIHPEIVTLLPAYTVYCCFDDPESSDRLSKPVAQYYDLCAVGNIAEVETYKSWGCKNAFWWPLGLSPFDYNPNITREELFTTNRDIDISIICEKKYVPDRIKRLNTYSEKFPNGKYYGLGWENGLLSEDRRIELLHRTKIGPNFHNSTGPINYRTFYLPANGVLQLCDNKTHLANVFKLNEEVVGFDTVEESIELTNYYLNHENERLEIALKGYERVMKDYTEKQVFERLYNQIVEQFIQKPISSKKGISLIRKQRTKTAPLKVLNRFKSLTFKKKR